MTNAQKWVAVTSQERGFALTCINDGIYGSDYSENGLRLTLLRSPAYSAYPDKNGIVNLPPDRFTPRIDQGQRFFRFWFPERPGALLRFLKRLGGRWNISLFHYRNHGAAYGRVLCGIQVPDDEVQDLHAFLEQLGYRWWEEDSNPAYEKFLR